MPVNPPIAGTPAEIYEQHMVPAIFARWAIASTFVPLDGSMVGANGEMD